MSAVFGAVPPSAIFKSSPKQWLVLLLASAATGLAFFDALRFTVANWGIVEEYSYGYFIPVIVAFLIWQRSDRLRQMQLNGAWAGLWLIALALALRLLGQFSAIRLFSQYGFVVAAFGVSVCAIGWRGTRVIAVPLALLLTMIPLPQFLLRELSHSLQLLSSQMGVALIRLFDISVFLEGNVIDLGSYKLQVVEACSGLRYLFPLVVLGFLSAYFFQGAWWKRAVIVLSTVPLTIVINSLRIGLIGVSVEHWGKVMAEGLLHDFEGGFMFLLCLGMLIGEMALLARLGGQDVSLRSVFGLELPAPALRGASVKVRDSWRPALVAALVLGAVGLAGFAEQHRTPLRPARAAFAEFPLELPGNWQGRTESLAPDVLAILALDDYFMANYTQQGSEVKKPPVNFYAAYYASQSGGESTHSPRTCLPGGGWAITQLQQIGVPSGKAAQPQMQVNRALIQKGEDRQLVYYWFAQRGRVLTDELSVKWFILRDGVVNNRSDGALLRLVTPLARNEDPAQAEGRLLDFLSRIQTRLPAFVPD